MGRGYATEAAYALFKYGFHELQLHRMFATCRPDNTASERVMEKLGMAKEGELREHFDAKAKWPRSLISSILANECVEL